MIMDFLAFDFETADAKNSAPCSLGITLVKDGIIEYTRNYLIDPQCVFSPYATRVHGISSPDVCSSPIFPAVWMEVEPLFASLPVVAHNLSFDSSVLEKVCDRYDLPVPHLTGYDTYGLATELLPDADSYRLSALCRQFDIDLPQEHNSGYDSAAAAQLFLTLQSRFPDGIHTFDPSFTRIQPQIHASFARGPAVYKDAEVEFDDVPIIFQGKMFVLTGDIEGYSRDELQNAIRNAGGSVASSVSKRVDYLVVGLQNVSAVKDKAHAKGTKILKAEQLRDQGCSIFFVDAESVIAALDTLCDNHVDAYKVYTSDDFFEIIKNAISPKYAACTKIELRRDKSFDSVVISYPATVYHPAGSVTFAHICLTGKQLYVSFPPRAESILRSLNTPLSFAFSDPWPRVMPIDFIMRANDFKEKIDAIFLRALNFSRFGCCSKYEKCSDAKECLHNDLIYAASACEYKRHLENGRIFYGKNRNI